MKYPKFRSVTLQFLHMEISEKQFIQRDIFKSHKTGSNLDYYNRQVTSCGQNLNILFAFAKLQWFTY